MFNGAVITIATADLPLHGQTVAADEAVLPLIPAAKRDSAVFDRPDELDLRRRHNPHLCFGRSPHNCLGAHFARAQLATALRALLDRFPVLHLANTTRSPPRHGPRR